MKHFQIKKEYMLLIIAIVLLIPIIFFPISCDLSIYYLGGRTILSGGKLYVDFIDLKPPLIYCIMSLVSIFTGKSELLIRLFDFIYQSATILSLYYAFGKFYSKKHILSIACIVYSILYVILNYLKSFQCECFAGLLLIWIIYFILISNKSNLLLFLSGFLTGILTGLKYTFGIIYFLPLIDFYEQSLNFKKIITKQFYFTIGFIISLLLSHIILLDKEVYQGFLTILNYLKFYSSTPKVNAFILQFFYDLLKYYISDKFSFLFLISFSLGFFYTIKNFKFDNILKQRFNILILFSILLFIISIAIEKKFNDYHYSRMFVPISFFVAIGLNNIITFLLNAWKSNKATIRILLICMIFFITLYSPLPRLTQLWLVPYDYITNTYKYDLLYTKDNSTQETRLTIKNITKFLNSKITSNDNVLVISTGSNQINFFLKQCKISKFAQSQYYAGIYHLKEYDDEFINEFHNSNWIVIQDDDRYLLILGHNLSSWEYIESNNQLLTYLNNNFKLVKQINNFRIFQRSY